MPPRQASTGALAPPPPPLRASTQSPDYCLPAPPAVRQDPALVPQARFSSLW
ncbi:hypothetical protein BOTBODRAFT_35656 [Botryobasidium botryosum FD-172 SS1]|uniref:Uncharacterized protein n=1 Tax=Botryobasidium botryosum (strain FD-172 SS1) TaxID=930990 RepID=A0A067MGU9_BOTB1|nr:hypothetical protein BOTBODRAFT_35656 [Botryobasidium botryosum FD-172 SS1]